MSYRSDRWAADPNTFTAPVTLRPGIVHRFDTSGGPVDQDLPSVASLGPSDSFWIKKGSPDLSPLTLIPDGSDTINDSAEPYILSQPGEGVLLIRDALSTNWITVAHFSDVPFDTVIDARTYGVAEPGISPWVRTSRFNDALLAAAEAVDDTPATAGVYVPRGWWDIGRDGVAPNVPGHIGGIKPQNNVSMFGDGIGHSFLRVADGDYTAGGDLHVIRVEEKQNIGFRDLTLYGNRYNIVADEQSHLIQLIESQNVSVQNVQFLDSYGDALRSLGEAPATSVAAKVWQVDVSGPTFVDETADFNSGAAGDFQPFPATEAVGDYCAFGFATKFNKLNFSNAGGTAGVGGNAVWEYWDGSTWQTLTGVADSTVDGAIADGAFTAGPSSGQVVNWIMPPNWAPVSINGSASLYYVRARVTVTYTTNPVYDGGSIETDTYSSFSAINCQLRGMRRAGFAFQRVTTRTQILGCRFRDIRGQACDFEPSGTVSGEKVQNIVIANNVFDNTNNISSGPTQVSLSNIDNNYPGLRTVVANNQFINGVIFVSKAGEVVIQGNEIAAPDGIVPITVTSQGSRFQIIGNQLVSTTEAIHAEASAIATAFSESSVEGNTIVGADEALHIWGASSLSVRNNTVVYAGSGATTAGIAFRCNVAGSGLKVSDNYVKGFDVGVVVGNSPEQYDDVEIVDNHFEDCATHIQIGSNTCLGIPTLGPNHPAPTVYSFFANQTYAVGADFWGSGTPEGAVSAYVAALYHDYTNGDLYIKASGVGTNTGWKLIHRDP